MSDAKTVIKGDVQLKDMIEMSEPGNALRLALIAKGNIHYVSNWNTWIVFKDGRWFVDDGGVELQRYASMVPQLLFTLATTLTGEDEKDYKELHIAWGRKSNTEPQFKRMVTLARHLDGVMIDSEELDSHPLLLNLINGTYDFKANQFREHDPGDLLTKMAMVNYDPAATCPLWDRCVTQWQPDETIQRFLQEIAGSGLIGDAVQHLFVNWGEGRNGKGTFYKHVQGILGTGRSGYAGTAPEDMLVETKWKVHDEEKARLRGVRMLLAPETSAGERLDEAGVKNLTGGDIMHARHLYGKTFDFKPTHTAFLHTNHEPLIRETDPGIWNRVIMIPWSTYIKKDQRDTSIDEKLEVEYPGILNWLIEGCRRWRADGIQVPLVIVQRTEVYRATQDHVGKFLNDMMSDMVADAGHGPKGALDYMPTATLRKNYEEWCKQEGTKPWSAAAVGKELRLKGWKVLSPMYVEGKSIRRWSYPYAGHADQAVVAQPSDQDLTTLTTLTTSLSLLNSIEKKEEENKEEVNIGNVVVDVVAVATSDWEPSEEEKRVRHREWLYDHGYPVPPTDEEIEAYQREYEHPYDQTPEAPEPPDIG